MPVHKTAGGDLVYAGSVAQQLEAVLNTLDVDACEAGGEDPFYVGNLAQVYRQHMQWRRLLPRVVPFYAVKCNPEPTVLELLAALGLGFDLSLIHI